MTAESQLNVKLDSLMNLVLTMGNSIDARFDQLESRIDNLETRFDKLETRFDNLEIRFNNLEADFDCLEIKFDNLAGRVDKLEACFVGLSAQVAENTSILMAIEHLTSCYKAEQDAHSNDIQHLNGAVAGLRRDVDRIDIVTADNYSAIARLKHAQ